MHREFLQWTQSHGADWRICSSVGPIVVGVNAGVKPLGMVVDTLPLPLHLVMDEKEVVERLGRPDKIVGRRERMRSRAWVCSTCREGVISPGSAPVPAPCARCGGIAFEVVEVEPQRWSTSSSAHRVDC